MEQRLKEIIAAVDLILEELDRVRPASCHDAVELNWRLRKLSIARGLLADSTSSRRIATPRSEASMPSFRTAGLAGLQRMARAE